MVSLSVVGSVSLQQTETTLPFTVGCYMGSWSQHWRSKVGSPFRGPDYSARKVPTDCCLWEWVYPLLCPHCFYQSEVGFFLFLIKSHFFEVVIRSLFRVAVPIFSFTFTFILGRSVRKVLWLCHHLATQIFFSIYQQMYGHQS